MGHPDIEGFFFFDFKTDSFVIGFFSRMIYLQLSFLLVLPGLFRFVRSAVP